jgi:hypothetical protein
MFDGLNLCSGTYKVRSMTEKKQVFQNNKSITISQLE